MTSSWLWAKGMADCGRHRRAGVLPPGRGSPPGRPCWRHGCLDRGGGAAVWPWGRLGRCPRRWCALCDPLLLYHIQVHHSPPCHPCLPAQHASAAPAAPPRALPHPTTRHTQHKIAPVQLKLDHPAQQRAAPCCQAWTAPFFNVKWDSKLLVWGWLSHQKGLWWSLVCCNQTPGCQIHYCHYYLDLSQT